MNKAFLAVLIIMVFFVAACQRAKVQTGAKPGTSDAAVDAVGNDINNVNSVEKDLGSEQLNDVDSGLTQVQNI